MSINRTLNAGYNEPIIVSQDNNAGSFTASLNINAGNMKIGDRGYVQVKTNPTQIENESITSTPFSVEKGNEGELSYGKFEYLSGTTVVEDSHDPVDGVHVNNHNFIVHNNNVPIITTTNNTEIKVNWVDKDTKDQQYFVPHAEKIDPDTDVSENRVDTSGDPIAPNTYHINALPVVKSTKLDISEVNLAPTIKGHTYKGRSDYVYVVKKVFVSVDGTEGKGLCHYVPYCASFETIKAAVNDNSAVFCEHINKTSLDLLSDNTFASNGNQLNSNDNGVALPSKYAYNKSIKFSVDDRFMDVNGIASSVNINCDIEYQLDEFNGINIVNMWQAIQTRYLTRPGIGAKYYYIVDKSSTGVHSYRLQKDAELLNLSGVSSDFNKYDAAQMKSRFNFSFAGNVFEMGEASTNAPAISNNEFYVRRNVANFVNNTTNESLYSVSSYNTFRIPTQTGAVFVNGPYFNVLGLAFVSVYVSGVVKRTVEKLGCNISWNNNCGGDYIAPLAKSQSRCYEFTVMADGKNNRRLVLSDCNNKSDEMVVLNDSDFRIFATNVKDPSTLKYVLSSNVKLFYTKDTSTIYKLNANPNISIEFTSAIQSPVNATDRLEIRSITFNMAGLENMMRFRLVNRLTNFDVSIASNKAVDANSSTYLALTNTDDVCKKSNTVSCLHQSLNPSVWDSKLDWDHSSTSASGDMNIYL